MGTKTAIEYADSSINPIRGCGGCELWNPKIGIKTCYAGRMITRFSNNNVWPKEFTKPIKAFNQLEKTFKWSDLINTDREDAPWLNGYPRIVFVNDMSDTFTEHIYTSGERQDLAIDWLMPYMMQMIESPHIYLILTKRPRRAVTFFKSYVGFVPSNFWVGTSITYPYTIKRAAILAELAPHCQGKLWLSMEPLYDGVVNPFHSSLSFYLPAYNWVVVGGESGPKPKKAKIADISQISGDCQSLDIPIFIKQLGSGQGFGSKGQEWENWPQELKIRQMPKELKILKQPTGLIDGI